MRLLFVMVWCLYMWLVAFGGRWCWVWFCADGWFLWVCGVLWCFGCSVWRLVCVGYLCVVEMRLLVISRFGVVVNCVGLCVSSLCILICVFDLTV